MFRSSRNIVLTLLGSAALLGCCCLPSIDSREEPVLDANGNPVRDANGNLVHHRHYYWHPWYGYSGGSHYYGGPYYHGYSSFASPGGSGGGYSGHSGVTSRGGFGSTGHAAAGS